MAVTYQVRKYIHVTQTNYTISFTHLCNAAISTPLTHEIIRHHGTERYVTYIEMLHINERHGPVPQMLTFNSFD